MEDWVPLLEIFLNSPCSESEASLWLQKSFNLSSTTTPISTSSFLSFLTTPSTKDSSPTEKRIMLIETLPYLVQARVLSFLAYDHQRFCKRGLCKLARIMVSGEDKGVDYFWVKKAAQQLLDLVSVSNYQWLSHLNLDSEEESVDDEFYSMPDWVRDAAKDSESMFSWLPISPGDGMNEFVLPVTASGGDEDDLSITDGEENERDGFDEVVGEVNVDELDFDEPLDVEVEKMVKSLKSRVLNVESGSKAVALTKEIRELCFRDVKKSLVILNSTETWRVNDEAAAILISHLSDKSEDGDELGWPAHILCSIVLPKFLFLKEPSSRALMNATLEHCKAHQRATEYALLFPLVLRNEGINNPICDVISRIIKECLHPAHVSAFCQKLLCEDRNAKRFICLPAHRCLISEELVWTESLFCLWQNILNHNVRLMQDSVDQLVRRVCEFAGMYSKSLKFGNFVLCLVNKCAPLLKLHKVLLTAAVEKTDSLVTKSILSKLSVL